MSFRSILNYIVFVISLVSTVSVPAIAMAEGADGAKERSLITIIVESGWAEWVLILLSVVALALTIQILVTVRREKLVPPDILAEVETLIDEGSFEDALSLCETEDSFFTRIIGAGLAKIDRGFDSMVDAVSEVGEEQATILHQQVGYLSLIASIATMLGLFGTVFGMIKAFNVIASKPGGVTAADLASTISIALVTTFTGLMIAIPTTAVYVIIRNRVTRVILEVNAITGELLEKMKEQ
ncbi:MAG: MotA/TolQ/ExbB proton channel family protein [Planctomycetota bacterium]|nr:MotA/TolQ/ExbB proton channel family protein [Planctomycetota bacterium]